MLVTGGHQLTLMCTAFLRSVSGVPRPGCTSQAGSCGWVLYGYISREEQRSAATDFKTDIPNTVNLISFHWF